MKKNRVATVILCCFESERQCREGKNFIIILVYLNEKLYLFSTKQQKQYLLLYGVTLKFTIFEDNPYRQDRDSVNKTAKHRYHEAILVPLGQPQSVAQRQRVGCVSVALCVCCALRRVITRVSCDGQREDGGGPSTRIKVSISMSYFLKEGTLYMTVTSKEMKPAGQ